MYRKFLVFVALALCFLTFSEIKAQSLLKNGEIPKDFSISFSRFVCKENCPDYELLIQANGTVEFGGRINTKVKGRRTSKITKEQIKRIILEFEKADFFALENSYASKKICPVLFQNMASVFISIKIDGREKAIPHDLGCLETAESNSKIFPQKLYHLGNRIDEIVKTKRWIGERK